MNICITFLKDYDAVFPKNFTLSRNFDFDLKKKKTTYFGEINIFGLSKDQTFRI
jgi:hypothetical protein